MNWKRNKSAKNIKATKVDKAEKNSPNDIKCDDILDKLNKIDNSVDKRALLEKIREEKERRELEKYKRREAVSSEPAKGFFAPVEAEGTGKVAESEDGEVGEVGDIGKVGDFGEVGEVGEVGEATGAEDGVDRAEVVESAGELAEVRGPEEAEDVAKVGESAEASGATVGKVVHGEVSETKGSEETTEIGSVTETKDVENLEDVEERRESQETDKVEEPNKLLGQLWLATKAFTQKKEQNKKSKETSSVGEEAETYDENELVEWDSKHAWKDVPKLFWLVLSLCVISILSFVLYTQYVLYKGNQDSSNYKIRSLNDADYVENDEDLIEPINLEAPKLISKNDYESDKFITNRPETEAEEGDENNEKKSDEKSDYALEGKGSKEEPYLIKNANDLVFIAEQIEDLPRKNEFRNSYFKQTADIKINDFTAQDMDKVYSGEIRPEFNWRPIGSSNKPFAGHYDGAGHKISGLYYELDGKGSNKSSYAGLFAYINSAEIKDLTIESAVVLAKNHKAVGTLSGIASNDSKIENVEINSYVENDAMVAGFIGKIIGRSVNLEAKNLKYKGRVISYPSDDNKILDDGAETETNTENTANNGAGEIENKDAQGDKQEDESPADEGKVDKIHTAAAFVAEAEGVNLSNFVNEAEILSAGSASGVIGHLSISSDQTIEKLSNNGKVYSDNLAAGLISSVDSAGSYKLVIKDNENNGEVSAKKRAAGILANISLYSSNNFSSDLILENNTNKAEVKADVAGAISARALLDKGQYFSAISNSNEAKVTARKLASGLIADFSFVGGNGTISQNTNEAGGEIATTLTDGRFLHGNAAGLIARLTFNIDKAFANLRIVNNSNKGVISSAKIAAGLIAETNVRINSANLDNEGKSRIEIMQNINFANVQQAHYISGLIGPFDILSSQDSFSQLRSKNQPIIMIKNNAVYGTLINDIYESKNYMVGLFMGPKLNFRPNYATSTEDIEESGEVAGNSYLNGDILLTAFNRETITETNIDSEAEAEYQELLEAMSITTKANRETTPEEKVSETTESSASETGESVSDSEPQDNEEIGDFVNHKNGAITYLVNNLFAGRFEINDKNLDSGMTNDLLRNLRMQTAALGKLTDYTWVENNYALPYVNKFANFNFVTAYQYPLMISYGNNSALNIKDATVVAGNKIHDENSYEGFDFGKTWAMDSKLEVPVPVQ